MLLIRSSGFGPFQVRRAHPVAALCGYLLIFLLSAPRARSAPGDEHWDRQFGWPGTSNYTYALREHGGKFYTSGFNPSSPGPTNSPVNVWDGTRWSTLGMVARSSLVAPYAVEFVGNNVYVGGLFSSVNGVSAVGLARWNGLNWSSVGGFTGAVFALATDGANLFAGGTFTNAGGIVVTNVARWDGTSWSAMGAGLGTYPTSDTGGVAALLWSGTELYAGGGFTNSGTVPVAALARWDGTRWVQFNGGVRSGNVVPAYVRALAGTSSELYVGGSFNLAGGDETAQFLAVNVAHWNGTSWGGPLQNLNNPVYALAILGKDVYLGGAFTDASGIFLPGLARWSGVTGASLVPSGLLNGEVNALLTVGSNLYVGGSFSQIGDQVMNHVACRTGTNWSALGSGEGLSSSGRAVAANAEGVFVGGVFTGAGSTPASRIAQWNGSAWSSLGSGLKGTNEGNGTLVNGIALRGPEVFVCGVFTNAGGIPANSIARWHTQTKTWSALGSGVDGLITTLGVSADKVYIGGGFQAAGGMLVNRFASWNGLAWSDVGGGVNSNVSVIVVSGSAVYLGGRFTLAGGSVPANRVARWTGAAWEALGADAENGLDGSVTAMTVRGSEVYVMGSFTRAGSVPANRVAVWNGAAWSALGSGLSGSSSTVALNTMAFSGGILYVGGSFTNAGGVYAPGIARWDGTNWSGLGSGMSQSPGSLSVLTIAASGDDLFVTGLFSGAGGVEARSIARWNPNLNFEAERLLQLSSPQRLGNGDFQFRVTANGVASYVIEATADLRTWTPLLTNSTSPFDFVDQHTTGRAQRFYRSRGQ